MEKTFKNREHRFTVDQFKLVMTFVSDDAMQKKWNAFCRKIDTKTDDFYTVLKTIDAFLYAPYEATVVEKSFSKKWSSANNEWNWRL